MPALLLTRLGPHYSRQVATLPGLHRLGLEGCRLHASAAAAAAALARCAHLHTLAIENATSTDPTPLAPTSVTAAAASATATAAAVAPLRVLRAGGAAALLGGFPWTAAHRSLQARTPPIRLAPISALARRALAHCSRRALSALADPRAARLSRCPGCPDACQCAAVAAAAEGTAHAAASAAEAAAALPALSGGGG